MAIELSKGDVVNASTEAVVNTVNCVGIMGKGIALQFKQAYPANFERYAAACRRKEIRLGKVFVFRTQQLTNPKYIINFPTKNHWRGKSRLEDIKLGLADLRQTIDELHIRSIAIPALGCGNGGLDWNVVRPVVETELGSLKGVKIRLFAPQGAPDPSTLKVRTSKPRLTRVRAALLLLLDRYKSEGYKHSLLELQKLAYFLQVTGEPLRLTFVKQQYGPYAEALNFVLQRLEGHYLRGYGDRSRGSEITLIPGAVDEAKRFLEDPELNDRVQRVSDLIAGYETPYALELLATVHWIAEEMPLAAVDDDVAVSAVYGWNARKKRVFKADHIRQARKVLLEGNWIAAVPMARRPRVPNVGR